MLSDYATNFALVSNANDTVTNIIWGNVYMDEYPSETEYIIKIDDLNVAIGDTYNKTTQKFYHGGVEVMTRQAIIDQANADNDEMLQALIDEE